MIESKIVSFVVETIQNWETGLNQFFGLWNEYAAAYEMKNTDPDPRPGGISRNVSAETPRAVNTLATSITRMQTADDPPFELRSDTVPEDKLFDMERKIQKNLENFQFKRNLLKGNRPMCLFGTQVWEKPYMSMPAGINAVFEGTAFRPVSLLQMAFNPNAYDMESSEHMSPVLELSESQLLNLANSGSSVWDAALIDQAITEGRDNSTQGLFSKSSRDARRIRAGYAEFKSKKHELIMYNGRVSKDVIETPEFQQMWTVKYGRTDDPRLTDITIGILDRKYLVRFHPTPYGTWHHLYDIGHFIEMELESLGYGVGPYGKDIQKDINRILRYTSNVAKFSLFNMFLAGRGSGLKSDKMNIIPWSAMQVDDVSQIKELRPQIEGITAGLKLYEVLRDDFRGVTHATTTLQAAISGATATESSLAQSEALRAISITAEVNSDAVIRPYLRTIIINMIDQNPYDTDLVRDVDIFAKTTTDKDYRPEHAKKLLEFLTTMLSIRSSVPIDFNPQPIIDKLSRAVDINPRLTRQPRPQADRMLDVLKRLQGMGGGAANEAVGEQAGAASPTPNISEPTPAIPTSPIGGLSLA